MPRLKFPKYWCYSEQDSHGYVSRTYEEISDKEEYDKIQSKRKNLEPGWKGFITNRFDEVCYYIND